PPPPRRDVGAADRARVRGADRAPRRAGRAAAGRAGDADGGRGRALHRRARHRGPADRDAARGDDGRRRRRQDRPGPRLRDRGLRGGSRLDAAGALPAAPRGGPRFRAPGRAARLRPQDQHPRLPGLAARLPGTWSGAADPKACRPEDHPRAGRVGGGPCGLRCRPRRRRRCRAESGQRHPRGPAQAPGGRSGGQVPTELTAISAVARRKEPPISELDEATVEEVFEEDIVYVCDFEIGDKVVYPHHGAGLVMTKETRELMGSEREYLTIKILHNELTVMVPTENAGKAGLRRVIDEEEIKKVTTVLTDDVSEMPKNWNRRFKYNREKIKTGDVFELAEVVRNLAIREMEKGLSTGEKQMYTRAKKILASEFMYALDKDEEGAEEYLDGLLEERYAATVSAA